MAMAQEGQNRPIGAHWGATSCADNAGSIRCVCIPAFRTSVWPERRGLFEWGSFHGNHDSDDKDEKPQSRIRNCANEHCQDNCCRTDIR